jgi:ribosomal protein S18 acetylase RimI-like enzyme
MNLTIRPATVNDIPTLQALNLALFQYERQYSQTYNLEWTMGDKGRKYFQKRLTNPNTICFIALDGDHPVGYILGFIDTYSYRTINPIIELENMFVAASHQRRGLGQALVKHLKDKARERGVRCLRVEALVQNQPALNFYRRCGLTDTNLILEQAL